MKKYIVTIIQTEEEAESPLLAAQQFLDWVVNNPGEVVVQVQEQGSSLITDIDMATVLPTQGVAEATVGNLHLHLEYTGEGHNGEYDPTDTSDEPLLRFTLSANGPLAKKLDAEGRTDDYDANYPERWLDIADCAYCTLIPAAISIVQANELAEKILNAIAEEYAKGKFSLRRICERASWIIHEEEPAVHIVTDGV